MFDIYKACVFIGLYCFMIGFACFEVYRKLKSEGAVVNDKFSLKKLSYIFFGSSVILLGVGCALYSSF